MLPGDVTVGDGRFTAQFVHRQAGGRAHGGPVAGGHGSGLAPFADGFGGDAGEAGGGFGAAEAIDDFVDGGWHGLSVAEIVSGAKERVRVTEVKSRRAGWRSGRLAAAPIPSGSRFVLRRTVGR